MLKNDSSSFLLASDVLFCSLRGHRKPNHSFTISISFYIYICIYIYIHIHISIYIHLAIIDIATSISLSISIYIHWYTNIDPFMYYGYSRYIIIYVLCFLCALYCKKFWSHKPKQNSSGRFGLQFDPSFSPKANDSKHHDAPTRHWQRRRSLARYPCHDFVTSKSRF